MLATWPEYMFTNIAQEIKSENETRDVKIENLYQHCQTIIHNHDAATLADVKNEIIYVKDEEDDNVSDHNVSTECNDEVPLNPVPNIPTSYQMEMLDEDNGDEIHKELKTKRLNEPIARISLQNYECKQCNFLYSSADQYRQHEIIHSKGKLECNVCNKNFKYPVIYQSHMNTHKGLAKFSCNICRKTYKVQSSYQIHMRLHIKERPYKCQTCDKIFDSRWALSVHTWAHRNHYVKRKYECEICGIRFRTMGFLKSHLLIHSRVLFECDVCHLQYSSPTVANGKRSANGLCSCLATKGSI